MAHPKILVVYYSRSSTTRKVAEAIAAELQCDCAEIVEDSSRSGMLGYLRSVIEARRQVPSRISAAGSAHNDPSTYDLTIIGTPVWAWSVSSPVRAYMVANKSRLPAVAFFCTLGGAGSDRAFAQMKDLAGKPPAACLAVTARDLVTEGYRPRLATFIESLRRQPPVKQSEAAKGAA